MQAMVPFALDLAEHRLGAPQQSGPMTVLPLFGPDNRRQYVSPLSGLKLAGVHGYGKVEIQNAGDVEGGVAIVPLHMGYIQDLAQNHALCRSAFIAPGQKVMFRDACCVQAGQGGYLQAADQWFFVLPAPLREEALKLRNIENYGKLWDSISRLNASFGMTERGHLEQVICRQRPYLTQFASRFELLPGQTGAMFFINRRLAGVEIAPNANYFAEVWTPLVCFCYGVAAMSREREPKANLSVFEEEPLTATSLDELRRELTDSRQAARDQLLAGLRQLPPESFQVKEEERYLDLVLSTAEGRNYSGQIVREQDRLIYASICAREGFLGEG